MAEKTFYDIHKHAMNLSHPYLLAFIQRFKIDQMLFLGSFASLFMEKKITNTKNLLSVMENDIGSYFLLIEKCLKEEENPMLKDGELKIGGNTYTKIVLTPLMMDFGYKDIKNPDIHYNKPSKKPIVEQVIDVFNGIKAYKNSSTVFEIYPFLGLNTKNYSKNQIEEMLDKYFQHYNGSRDDLYNNMGNFDGDIEHLGSNSFAGIKLYPPLDFDPWPEDPAERAKVEYLYNYCCDKNIPITVHCSEGGFAITDEAHYYTNPTRWQEVLSRYTNLKINLAHFGRQNKYLKIFPQKEWLKTIANLILSYDNVYTDFSYRGVDDSYYESLKELLDKTPSEEQEKLKNRILFGTDFMISLMDIESYNNYLDIFSKTNFLTGEEKNTFCSINPERFLFTP
jgi:hypothetical protein